MRSVLPWLILVPFMVACGTQEDTATDTEACFSDEDCPANQRCVITHDHEGDDHDHGGDCEDAE